MAEVVIHRKKNRNDAKKMQKRIRENFSCRDEKEEDSYEVRANSLNWFNLIPLFQLNSIGHTTDMSSPRICMILLEWMNEKTCCNNWMIIKAMKRCVRSPSMTGLLNLGSVGRIFQDIVPRLCFGNFCESFGTSKQGLCIGIGIGLRKSESPKHRKNESSDRKCVTHYLSRYQP